VTGTGRNWAGNLTYRSRELLTPRTLEELREIVATEPSLRALGSRHSFTDIADTTGVQVSLAGLASVADIRITGSTARIPAGLRHGDVVGVLNDQGVAVANLASLPHIGVAGAVQTGTHGSGDRIGSLATQVAAIEMVTPAEGVVRLERGDAEFPGAVVALGALGIVTTLELDVEPAYDVAQRVYDDIRWDAALASFDDLTGAGTSVSLFTTWRDADVIDSVWVKSRTDVAAPPLPAML
jgi:xylitol oxidase